MIEAILIMLVFVIIWMSIRDRGLFWDNLFLSIKVDCQDDEIERLKRIIDRLQNETPDK
jgi:hypothetical protein